jgi:hypothetical protein
MATRVAVCTRLVERRLRTKGRRERASEYGADVLYLEEAVDSIGHGGKSACMPNSLLERSTKELIQRS